MQRTDHLISNVPESRVSEAVITRDAKGKSVAQYNVAAWLYLRGTQGLSVSLVLNYQDGTVRREVTVDQGTLDQRGRVMLSGIARLSFLKRISDLQIRLQTTAQIGKPTVEELFFEALEKVDAEPKEATSPDKDPLSKMGLL
ncbi:MAG: hypothetical protein GAK45_00508 [Pseudomonas citronellolis]|nr:MAG: hypothetical protein GAK45_00508 [Pseudomonas citronellolis]